jgi:hypothetical protein
MQTLNRGKGVRNGIAKIEEKEWTKVPPKKALIPFHEMERRFQEMEKTP